MAAVNTILIVGVTGHTGTPIAKELLEQKQTFKLIGAVRPSSVDKLTELRKQGLEVRECDVDNATPEELLSLLKGVDIVISCLIPLGPGSEAQKHLIDAAKVVGVKRFIPSNFGPASQPGHMLIHDIKLDIIQYLKEAQVPYTIIDIGWWTHQVLPLLDPAKAYDPRVPRLAGVLRTIFGSGDVKTAVLDVGDIGKYVARIITDPRTRNRYVFAWAEEVSQNEAYSVARAQVAHWGFEPRRMTKEQTEDGITAAKESKDIIEQIVLEYSYSIFIRGDNTIENAKKEEYGSALDARELYPDIVPKSLKEVAKDFYADFTGK